MDAVTVALKDRVTIVTGGGAGIGKAIALCFADAGARVVIADREAACGEGTAAEIRAMGRKALAVEMDVREAEQVDSLVKRTLAEFGRIDVIANNAGGSFPMPLLDYTPRGWETLIRENLNSVFLCINAVGKVMVAQKSGAIINISSVAGIRPIPNSSAYSAAKAGIINLTMSAAIDLGPHGVRVNCIAPGYILTPGVAELYAKNPGQAEERMRIVPLRRLGKPEDIGTVAVFLASDAAAYVNGATLPVDGGWAALVA
ncbi:MAG: glucose 1-dehydrogenase [Pseudomonadota bacterium]